MVDSEICSVASPMTTISSATVERSRVALTVMFIATLRRVRWVTVWKPSSWKVISYSPGAIGGEPYWPLPSVTVTRVPCRLGEAKVTVQPGKG